MKYVLLATALIVASPLAADTLTLSEAMAGGTLQGRNVDMSAYWLARDGGYELTAVYASTDAELAPARVTMLLQDGDAVRFGLPGHMGVVYTFEADASAVTISSTDDATDFAAK